ncbi:MAG: hypothetical protein PHU43_08115 [Candidatus Bipolaricaulis sp.]|nr:hypothetical protein [Candidatus Bipolaricaulis sp.]
MRRRAIGAVAVWIAALGFSGFAAGSWSAEWTTEVVLEPGDKLLGGSESTLGLRYATESILWTSGSEFRLDVGYLWQEVAVHACFGAWDAQGIALFGPSTADFLYAQAVVALRLAGVDVDVFWAVLGGAVLGGPADGLAVRLAGRVGGFDIVSIAEFGARVEDEGFRGIDIVHGATGRYRHYATDPVVPGHQVWGEKLSVSGPGFGPVGNARAIAYATADGFDFFAVELGEVDLGIGPIETDLKLIYDVEAKSAAATPTVAIGGGLLCVAPHFGVYSGEQGGEVAGLGLGGVSVTCDWNGVAVRSLTVLDAGRFVITTEESGSIIESIDDALENGDDYYADYCELLSIAAVWGSGCGGVNRVVASTYFSSGGASAFVWAMGSVEASVRLSTGIDVSVELALAEGGLDCLGVGLTLRW